MDTSKTEASKTEANKTLVRRFVEEVKNQRRLDNLGEYFAADYQEHNQTVASFGGGVAGYQAFLGHLFAAFPDDVLTVDLITAEGDLVSYWATESGTHKGEFLGVPATNKEATWTEVQFFRIANGRVVEHWVEVDIFGWFTQLGIIPPMG